MRKFRLLVLLPVLMLSFCLSACNGYDTAVKASNVIAAILQVAQAEVSVVPAADQVAYANFVTLGITLQTQLQTCIESADSGMSKSGKYLACFNGFATGLSSPAELTQLHLLSPDVQKKVQLYLAAITVGVNTAVA